MLKVVSFDVRYRLQLIPLHNPSNSNTFLQILQYNDRLQRQANPDENLKIELRMITQASITSGSASRPNGGGNSRSPHCCLHMYSAHWSILAARSKMNTFPPVTTVNTDTITHCYLLAHSYYCIITFRQLVSDN